MAATSNKSESQRASLGDLYKRSSAFEVLGVPPRLHDYPKPQHIPDFTFNRLRGPEHAEGKKLQKYEVNIPLTSSFKDLDIKLPQGVPDISIKDALHLDMETVTLTVWSEHPLQLSNGDLSSLSTILQRKEPPILTSFFASGFLANSEQLDRQNSFVETLSKSFHENDLRHTQFSNIIIGISCPGFSGSETDNPPDKDSIGVERYSHLLKALMVTLQPKKTALIGHSAGGAAALLLQHQINEIDKETDPYMYELIRKTASLRHSISALHPAINSSVAKQFIAMKDLNQLKYMFHVDMESLEQMKRKIGFLKSLPEDILTRIVVKWALGLNPFTTGTKDQEDQVTLHCDEFNRHPHAGYAKLDDLKLPQKHGQETGIKTLIITGSEDRITPLLQILQGFALIGEKERKVTPRMIQDAEGILDVAQTGHDDIFIYPSVAQAYADRIAQLAVNIL